MTFNAASRLRSLEDRSAALGSSRCKMAGMHSVPKSAVLPHASGVGGLSRRLLNIRSGKFVRSQFCSAVAAARAGQRFGQRRPGLAGETGRRVARTTASPAFRSTGTSSKL